MVKDPVASSSAEYIALHAANKIQHYLHDEERIQEFVRNMLDDMDISFPKAIGQSASCMPLGFSVGELNFGLKNNKLILRSIDSLEHEYISFRGKKGVITEVIYNNNQKVNIPYFKVIHCVRGYVSDFDNPFGVPQMKAALPYIKAKNTFLTNMIIASRYFTTGIIYAKIDSSKDVFLKELNSNLEHQNKAKVVSKAEAIAKQLNNLDRTNTIIADISDDIGSVQINDGSQFWNFALDKMDRYIQKAFSITDGIAQGQALPQTATYVNNMFSITDSSIFAFMQQFERQLIQKAIKPVILANFGRQKNYGRFSFEPTNPQKEAEKFQQLMSAAGYGLVDANDFEVKNLVRKFLGLSPINAKIEASKAQEVALQQQLLQQIQGTENPETPPVESPETEGEY